MPKFVVRLARDLTEYYSIEIEAEDEEEAEEAALEFAREKDTVIKPLEWDAGGDRSGTYVSDCEEI